MLCFVLDLVPGRLAQPPALTALDHEAIDDAMKNGSIVVAIIDILQEVLDRDWRGRWIQLDRDDTHRRVDHHDGRILRKCEADGFYDIRYDDGDFEENVPEKYIRVRNPTPRDAPARPARPPGGSDGATGGGQRQWQWQ